MTSSLLEDCSAKRECVAMLVFVDVRGRLTLKRALWSSEDDESRRWRSARCSFLTWKTTWQKA